MTRASKRFGPNRIQECPRRAALVQLTVDPMSNSHHTWFGKLRIANGWIAVSPAGSAIVNKVAPLVES